MIDMAGIAASSQSVVRSKTWLILLLLALASVIANVERVNLSFAIIDIDFKAFFQINNAERGVLSSAFFWSYAALQIPAGWLIDRYGSKYPLVISFTVWSILTAITAFATGYSTLFAIRLLLGVGEAAMQPAGLSWIRRNFPESRRGLAIGLFMSGTKFGPAIGAALAAWLIEAYGWQSMFLIMGLAGLVWLVPYLATAPNDYEAKPAAIGAAKPVARIPTGKLILNPVLIGTIITTFCYMYFVYFCLTWMPAYLREARGLSISSSGLFTTFSFAGMATVAIMGGWLADRCISRGMRAVSVRKVFTIVGFLLASTEFSSALVPSVDLAVAISIISLSGLGLATANYWALTQTLMPKESIGTVSGIQNCAASVSGICAPIITGWLVESTGGYAAAMNAVLVFLLIGISAYLFLVREKYAPRPAA